MPGNDDPEGCFLEVSLNYPKELHQKHNSYPLAVEKMYVDSTMLSPETANIAKTTKLSQRPRVKKLVPNLYNKSNYILHSRNLKFYLEQGMKLEKIHRGVKFSQKPFLADFILFNTAMRKGAGSDFARGLWKMANNSVFGKNLEDQRRHSKIKVIMGEAKLAKIMNKPWVKQVKIINSRLALVEVVKEKVTLNKPIYVGAAILDLSKLVMYDFHYNYMVKKYGESQQLLFTDTDSLCYKVECPDIYEDIRLDRDKYFDTSNYNPLHKAFFEDNKKKLGTFTDETGGVPIIEFVGLKPKLYAFICEDNYTKITAKGVVKATNRTSLKFSIFLLN